MLSETVNKVKPQPSKKADKATKNIKKDNPITKKETNVGLRVPGSNWQAFKSLVTESNTQIKKRKPELTSITQAVEHAQNQKYDDDILVNGQLVNVKQLYHKSRSSRKNSQQTTKTVTQMTTKGSETKPESETGLTKCIAMDCEMVGIGDGTESMVARVSIVNKNGVCVYDKYVKPTEEIKDYRTAISGIRPEHLKNGTNFQVVQKEVAEILKGRILVGHALYNDLDVLFLSHPRRLQRDTSRYKPFRKVSNGNTPSLKKLATELLGIDIQSGEHNSIEDARATMQLYQLFRRKWEIDFKHHR